MTKYIKVTDGDAVGYHAVEDDFKLPYPGPDESYEFVPVAEARKEHPALFGKDPAAVEDTKSAK